MEAKFQSLTWAGTGKKKGTLQLGDLTTFKAPVSGRCHSSFIARAQLVVIGLHTELLSVGLRLLTC